MLVVHPLPTFLLGRRKNYSCSLQLEKNDFSTLLVLRENARKKAPPDCLTHFIIIGRNQDIHVHGAPGESRGIKKGFGDKIKREIDKGTNSLGQSI